MKPLSAFILSLAAMLTIWIVGLLAVAYMAELTLDPWRVAIIGATNFLAYLVGYSLRSFERRRRTVSRGYDDPLDEEMGSALRTLDRGRA